MAAKFGLGLAALGRPGYINLGHAEDLNSNYAIGAMRKHAHVVLDAAWESGVRYFDVARSYGRGEEYLSTWISDRGIKPDEIEVGSKWGYTYTAAWKVKTAEGIAHEVKRHELKVLQAQFAQTMRLLNDHLNLYQIHSATLESGVLENDEVLECLNGLRKSGIKVGLTVSGIGQPEAIEKALDIKFDGELLFDSVQATWNLLEVSAETALKKASQAGMKVIIKEGLANGRLTSRNDAESFRESRQLLEKVAAENEATIDAIALAAAFNQDWATTVLSGAATSDHLLSNLKANNIEWSAELSDQLGTIKQSPQEYWAERSALEWN